MLKDLDALAKRLADRRYTTILDVHSVKKTWLLRAYFFFRSDSPYVWHTFRKPRLKRFLFAMLKSACPERWRPGRYSHHVKAWTLNLFPQELPRVRSVSVSAASESKVKVSAASERIWLGVAPGSAWKAKQWSPERFTEMCVWALREFGLKPALIGLSKDPVIAVMRRQLAEVGIEPELLMDLREPADLEQQVRRCRVVLSNDSFAAHFSEAVGTPVVSLFTATHPDYGFGPLREDSRAVTTRLWCSPCSKDGELCFRMGSDRYRCRSEIEVEDVQRQMRAVLGGDRG